MQSERRACSATERVRGPPPARRAAHPPRRATAGHGLLPPALLRRAWRIGRRVDAQPLRSVREEPPARRAEPSRASTSDTEVEVLAATQRIDVYSVPDPARAAERHQMGLLGELSAEPSLFEPFRNTPSLP